MITFEGEPIHLFREKGRSARNFTRTSVCQTISAVIPKKLACNPVLMVLNLTLYSEFTVQICRSVQLAFVDLIQVRKMATPK